MGDSRGAYKVLMGKPEGRGPLGRPTCRWEDNITTDRREVGWGHGIDLAWGRDRRQALVNTVMNIWVL
jgi:hypothetical protein